MEIITILGTFPDMNQIITAAKQHWAAYAHLKHTYTNLVVAAAKNHAPVRSYPVSIHFDWYCENRRVDPDNIAAAGKKMVLDGLVAAGILEGDGWAHIAELSDKFFVDAKQPRVVVSIYIT